MTAPNYAFRTRAEFLLVSHDVAGRLFDGASAVHCCQASEKRSCAKSEGEDRSGTVTPSDGLHSFSGNGAIIVQASRPLCQSTFAAFAAHGSFRGTCGTPPALCRSKAMYLPDHCGHSENAAGLALQLHF
jgi:hypothetical protein